MLAEELEAVGEEGASEKSVPAPAGSLAGLERDGEGSGEGAAAARGTGLAEPLHTRLHRHRQQQVEIALQHTSKLSATESAAKRSARYREP